MTRLTIPAIAIALTACSPTPRQTPDTPQPAPNVICTMEARSALQVTVLDAQGNRLPAGTSVRVIARLPGYADTASVVAAGDTTSVGLAHERAGTFTVEVTATGFARMEFVDLTVVKTADGCHVQTRQVVARLPR